MNVFKSEADHMTVWTGRSFTETCGESWSDAESCSMTMTTPSHKVLDDDIIFFMVCVN